MNSLDTLILHLSLIDNIGSSTINHIAYHNDFDELNLYFFNTLDFQNIFGISYQKSKLIVEGLKDKSLLEKELDLIEKNQIKVTTILDSNYPSLLKEIEVPPSVLYYKGNLKNSEHSISVVGSRAASGYGERVIKQLIPGLESKGWIIVSGGAFGIDTLAHKQALAFDGRTIAVLGSGLLKMYPAQNRKLFDQIIEKNGAVMSSFNLNMEPLPGNFPARNRIVSGLSRGTLVIQAAKKSGALITAKYALEQGREVFAVPGLIDNPLSEGCHYLIKSGAKLVNSVEDILQEFDITYQQKTVYDIKKEGENPILEACVEPLSLEEIHNITGIGFDRLQIQLFDLQIEGRIRQNFVGLWERI
jgi:DNA processing protein